MAGIAVASEGDAAALTEQIIAGLSGDFHTVIGQQSAAFAAWAFACLPVRAAATAAALGRALELCERALRRECSRHCAIDADAAARDAAELAIVAIASASAALARRGEAIVAAVRVAVSVATLSAVRARRHSERYLCAMGCTLPCVAVRLTYCLWV